ncbi:hypothetical protein N9346_00370 [Gammaproteobacteria bacterium]|nr:hypothetical protein [Gammaproteobacteria bacterium]
MTKILISISSSMVIYVTAGWLENNNYMVSFYPDSCFITKIRKMVMF